MCVDTDRERKIDDLTTTAGDCCFLFSLRLKIFFSFLEKRFLFLPPVRRRHNLKITIFLNQKVSPNPKKRGRSRHIWLSFVSRSPGKLFKRTLTYCGKRTNGYVKREREREREKRRRGAFSPSSYLGL